MLSAGYLRAFTEEHAPEWEWEVIETTINDDPGQTALRLMEARPDIICATTYLFNQEHLLGVLGRTKAMHLAVKIYLGGPQFQGNNEIFLRRHPWIDAVIRGDESSLYRLLNGETNAPGVCRLNAAGQYQDHGCARYEGEIDELPSPYLKGYFPPGKPFYQIETTRGCTAECTFCSSAGTGLRYFSIERIRRELQVLAQLDVREIRILDRTFNHGGERPPALLHMFRTEFPQMRFHLEINPALQDDELLAEIKSFSPGKLHLEAGIQSLTSEVLREIRRPATPEKLLGGIKRLRECGNPAVHADLIAGLPRQRWDELLDNVKRLVEADLEEIQLETLKILPGTKLSDTPPRGMAFNPEPPYEVLKTDEFSADELYRARILSRLIDIYYHAGQLRPLFGWAVRYERNFLPDYIVWLRQHTDPLIKPSPQGRLELLERFAEDTGRSRLAELTKFFWLRTGMAPEKYGITVHKCVPGTPPEGEEIWTDAEAGAAVRHFSAEFSCRAAEVLISDGRQQPTGKTAKYRFYLRHGQKTVAIRREELAKENKRCY